jgi:hypothetical protein
MLPIQFIQDNGVLTRTETNASNTYYIHNITDRNMTALKNPLRQGSPYATMLIQEGGCREMANWNMEAVSQQTQSTTASI